MPAAKKKPVEAVLPAVDDDPRAGLKAAIAAHAEAQKVVEAKQQTIRRALDQIEASEKNLERCRDAVAKAKETDVKSAAAQPDAPWHFRQAFSDVETAEHALEVADGAHKKLKRDLAELEDNAADAANGVLIEVKLLMMPGAQKLLEESIVLKKRLHLNKRVLDLITDCERHPNDQPRFRDEMRRMRAAGQRDEVFAELRAEAQHLTFGSPDDVLDALAVWKAALLALRTDPLAELPEVK
jgi:hypothetical protein